MRYLYDILHILYEVGTILIVRYLLILGLTLGTITPTESFAKLNQGSIETQTSTSAHPPWQTRVRIPKRSRAKGFALVDPDLMPQEPHSPAGKLDEKRFASALKTVCDGRLRNKKQIAQYSEWIIRYAKKFDVDPFTIASLIRRQSSCRNRTRKNSLGIGLARIRHEIHQPFVNNGSYTYWVRVGRSWKPRQLSMGRFAFTPKTLRKAEANIYFASALLAIYTRQGEDLDQAFPQTKHRHPISHMIWGDRVHNTDAEERILRDRRRMLEYYTGIVAEPKGRYKPLSLRSPLDGGPRKITSGFWNRRGFRRHSSLDFLSHIGEPVRAIADGRIYFAGYQKKRGHGKTVHPSRCRRIRRSKMGIGGLFVLIDHKHGLRSGYFHLIDYTVKNGQRVKAGQLIGHVGSTGIKFSREHLHFELTRRGHHIDPMKYLKSEVLPIKSTHWGRHISQRQYRWSWRLAKKGKKAKARARRAKSRKAKLRKAKRAKKLSKARKRKKAKKKRG